MYNDFDIDRSVTDSPFSTFLFSLPTNAVTAAPCGAPCLVPIPMPMPMPMPVPAMLPPTPPPHRRHGLVSAPRCPMLPAWPVCCNHMLCRCWLCAVFIPLCLSASRCVCLHPAARCCLLHAACTVSVLRCGQMGSNCLNLGLSLTLPWPTFGAALCPHWGCSRCPTQCMA